MGIIEKIRNYLNKTRNLLKEKLSKIFKNFSEVNDEFLNNLLEILISSDIGYETSKSMVEKVKKISKERKIKDEEDLSNVLKEIMLSILEFDDKKETNIKKESERISEIFPRITMFVGINGVGKTTSIAKLAYYYKNLGKKVLIVAGDTFRAAAKEQLMIWSERTEVEVYAGEFKDPGAVIWNAINIFKDRKFDILICDTAGRLNNQKDLMQELLKIKKIIEKKGFPIETLITLDATTGQNAVSQVKNFSEIVKLNGIFLTKIDTSSKGGIIFPLKLQLGLDVTYIGSGESKEDIDIFDAKKFVDNIF